MTLNRMIALSPQPRIEAGPDRMISGDIAEKVDYFLMVCRSDGLSPYTINDYTKKLNALYSFLLSHEILYTDKVSAFHLRSFLDNRRATCSPITVHAYYRSINRFFNWLVEEELLDKSPMDNIRPPRVDKKVIVPFKPAQIETMLSLCPKNNFLGSRNRAIILTFYDTGLRLSELANIQLADIDADREIIKVKGKGARERFVRIGLNTQLAIARYIMFRRIKGFDMPCLWVTEEGRALAAEGVRMMVRILGERAGLKGVRRSPHTLRHSFATQALRNGADIKEVQTLLGHSTLNMTLRYVETIKSEDAIKGHRGTRERRGFSPVDRMGLK